MSEKIVPFLYRRTGILDLLGLLALRRINKLRVINALRWHKSPPATKRLLYAALPDGIFGPIMANLSFPKRYEATFKFLVVAIRIGNFQ